MKGSTRRDIGKRRKAAAAQRWGAGLFALGVGTAGLAVLGGAAEAQVPTCGGNQSVKMAPYSCQKSTTIDGTTFSVLLNVDNNMVTVSYTLDAPRAVDTPLRVRAHQGISSEPNVSDADTVLPAGATSATLSVVLECGQIDVKAVFTGNGDARGRVTAPFVTEANNCADQVPTTTGATTVPTTAATTTATSVPSSSTPTSAGQVTATTAGPTTTGRALTNTALPVTGSGGFLALLSAGFIVAGIVVAMASRSRSQTT